ncbi:MAG: hypothetical protein PUA93_05815 [Eubacteriales bacterium]|nr:hypothetical protein [Eubacteriales bacterium]
MEKTNNYLHDILFRKRTLGGYLSLGCALYFLLLSILYLCIKGGSMKVNNDSPLLPFLMMLIGSLVTISTLFYKSEKAECFLPVVSAVCYGVALGRQLELVAYPIADKITGVNWFGGSFAVYFTFFVLIFVGTVTAIVALFFKQTESEK